MAEQNNQELLEISVNTKQLVAEMQKFQRSMTKVMEKVGKSVNEVNRDNVKATKAAKTGNKEWAASVEDLTKVYKEEAQSIQRTQDTISQLEKSAEKASSRQKKAIKENIKLLKERANIQIKALRSRDEKEGRSVSARIMKESGKELGQDLKKVFEDASTLFSKDLKGAIEGSTKFLIRGIKAGTAATALRGVKLQSYGSGLAERAKDKKGLSGAAMRVGGGALKEVGGMISKLNPLIASLSKMGPIIGMVGTSLMSIFKLFLDMDAKVKEFNKDILQSASTTSFLAQAGGDANLAFSRVEATLEGLRNSAYSLENLDWGLKADDHKAIVNVLTQEGLSLRTIGGDASKSAKDVEAFASELSHVSVAYSRTLGVPLQEINQLQAEMVQDLGIGLGKTKLSFEQINRSAQEAGVEGNRFFAMIRGVSQDLALWNNRMGDAVNLLGKLMKNMSPRTAQNFFQTIQKGFKGMGRTELLKTALLNGVDASMKTVKSEIARNVGGMAENIGRNLGYSDEQVRELAETIKTQGRSAVEPLMDKLDTQTRGAVREALSRMELMQSRAKKGLYGLGEAMSDLGPVAAAEAKRNIALRFASSKGGKSKNLIDAAGEIGVGAMAENQGIDIETYNNIAMMEQTMEDQRRLLESRLGDPDTQSKLLKAGIKATKDGITEASWTQLMDTLSEDQQDLLNGVSETERLAKNQAKAQMSFYDKFDVLIDFLMNKLYNLFMGIWDTILSFPFVDEKHKIKKELSDRTIGTDLGQILNSKDPSKSMAESKSLEELNKNMSALAKDSSRKADFDVAAKKIADQLGTKNLEAAAEMAGLGIKAPAKPSSVQNTFASPTNQFDAIAMAQSSRYQAKNGTTVDEFLAKFTPEEVAKILEKGVAWTGDETTKVSAALAGLEALNMKAQAPDRSMVGGTPVATSAQPVAAATSAVVDDTAKIADNNLNLNKDQLRTMQSIDNQMDKFKMDSSFLSGPYSKAVEGSSLKALRTALFEYYMYKDLNQANVVSAMQSGALNPASFSSSFTAASAAGMTGEQQLERLTANAAGGVVTGVSGGLANVTAAAGEGLASVGVGEKIVPAGGGGGKSGALNVNVEGVMTQDLARFIKTKVVETIYEYKRKERFS